MKRYVGIALILASSQSVAIECGPITPTMTIRKLAESVKEVGQKITTQSGTLNQELRGLASSLGDLRDNRAAIANVQLDYDLLRGTSESALRVWDLLNTALILADIRDRMSTIEDKKVVSRYLSHQLWRTFIIAENANQSINHSLANISRPGFAVDIAKLRDVNALVVKDFAKCTSTRDS